MKLRSPSGRLVNNPHIVSKLQLRHERLIYSSDFGGVFNASDFYWMNSSLVHIKKMQKFALDNKQSAFYVVADLVRKIDKLQVSEFFIENTRSFMFCNTGVRFSANELAGSWYRHVCLKAIAHKLIMGLVYVSSIKHLDDKDTGFSQDGSVQLKPWLIRYTQGQQPHSSFISKSLAGCIAWLFEKNNLCSNGSDTLFIACTGQVIEISDTDLGIRLNNSFVLQIQNTQSAEKLNGLLMVNGQAINMELGLLNNILLNLPHTQILSVACMFVQSKLTRFELDLKYDQIRLVCLIVLNFVLVKFVAKTFRLNH